VHAGRIHQRREVEPVQVGDYSLIGLLSHSVTGTNYLASSIEDTYGPHFVSVKELRPRGLGLSAFAETCRTEAALASSVEHPNVGRTLGVVQEGNVHYWLTEYLDGQPFGRLVQSSRMAPQVSLRMRLHVIHEALGGLHAAHQVRDLKGNVGALVHGGLRPSNVIVSCDGSVKVVGFGLARALATRPEWRDVPGRLRYLAPEQLLENDVDVRADIFSMGVMLWESISLRRFASNSTSERVAYQRRLSGGEPRIAQVFPQVPPRLARICDKAMSLDRRDRFQSARAFQEALSDYMDSSGAPCKVTVLGYLVATKFESERAEVKRLMENVTRARSELRTQVDVRRAPPPPLDDGEPTIVRDIASEQSRITRSKLEVVLAPERWRWVMWSVASLAATLLAMWAGYLWAGHL
jgi:serine/threonine protein kinase